MTNQCARMWEAEAVEDGRLDDAARASFERHLQVCTTCAKERAALERLRRTTKGAVEPEHSSSLDRRRLRAAILRDANRRTLSDRGRSRVWLPAVAVSALVAMGVWMGLRGHHAPNRGELGRVAEQPIFEVSPRGVASWHVDRTGPLVQVSLINGMVAVHVAKLDPGQRFSLILPDGEIEVRGTQFTARVEGQHTTAVDVTEGVVALRIHSLPERALQAGDTWAGQVDETPPRAGNLAPPSSGAVAPHDLLRGASSDAVSLGATAASPSSHARASASTHDESSPSSAPQSGGALFKEAMAAFSAGSYETADSLFKTFEGRFPDDARNEDAAFLRIVICKRLGNMSGASRLARAYLERYPHGWRRAEVEQFVTAPL